MRQSFLRPIHTPLFIDNRKDVAAAFSCRLMKTGYTGGLLRVRRSSDNAEIDIFADSTGFASWTVISNFIGGGTGAISLWYDQSGFGRNLLQATALNQPQVGFLTNGRAGLIFNGTNSIMQTAVFGAPTVGNTFTYNVCYRKLSATQGSYENFFDGLSADNNTIFCQPGNAQGFPGMYSGGNFGPSSPIANGDAPVNARATIGGVFAGSSSVLIVNSTKQATYTTPTTAVLANLTGVTVGCRGDGTSSRFTHIEMQEVIVFTGAHTQRQCGNDSASARQAWNF